MKILVQGSQYCFLLWALLSGFSALSQHTHKIVVYSLFTNKPIENAKISIPKLNVERVTDADGIITFRTDKGKEVLVSVDAEGYEYYENVVDITTPLIEIGLFKKNYELNDIEITEKKSNSRSKSYLRSIEGTSIFAGKKSEVIHLDEMSVNMANNNAREIYAEISGLNIWESPGGLQLHIGGRGLNPNRAAHFNVRQNGHDMSADALGYPESYYTPPPEVLKEIRITRGASSLQYGTQFGGVINFITKSAPDTSGFHGGTQLSYGAFNLLNVSQEVTMRKGRHGLFVFGQFKRGDGWRKYSTFNQKNVMLSYSYDLSRRSEVTLEYTHMDYLAQQPGGLDDQFFDEDPRRALRSRNWFQVDWNLFHVNFNYRFSSKSSSQLNTLECKAFGLIGRRSAVGFRNYRPSTVDDPAYFFPREVINGRFRNAGLEIRYLRAWEFGHYNQVTVLGSRSYIVNNLGQQGVGTSSANADFSFANTLENLSSEYRYPNKNQAFFLEHIFYLNDNWSIIPGLRYEFINTESDGYFRTLIKDLNGDIIYNKITDTYQQKKRSILLAGLGVEYKNEEGFSLYSNVSQNFRAVTFSDINITNPSYIIDSTLKDEKGWNVDIGIRNQRNELINYDLSSFLLFYGNRIGEVQIVEAVTRQVKRLKTNTGQAVIYGLETYASLRLLKRKDTELKYFSNVSMIGSEYLKSSIPDVQGNVVEFVPLFNIKQGIMCRWKKLHLRAQYTYVSEQFSDASNDIDGGASAVTGIIPSFYLIDLGMKFSYKSLQFNGGINNVLNRYYFTQRAIGYPGPGIIPADGRSFYVGVTYVF